MLGWERKNGDKGKKAAMSHLVTVVTPCFNSAHTLERTMQSVLAQTYTPIEFIVLDGGSTDNTIHLLKKYSTQLKFVSEPDRGQSDAINKGWHMAQGDILAWLNADDIYLPDTVQTAVDYFSAHPEVYWIYGSLEYRDDKGNFFPYRNPSRDWDYDMLLGHNCYIPQPTVFLRRQVIEDCGYLEENLHYGMDYEYWLRIGRKYPGRFVPALNAVMTWARTTKTEGGGVKRIQEIEAVIRRYGGNDLPRGMHHEWTMAFIEQSLKQIRAGHLRQAAQSFSRAWRYPRTLPRGMAKTFIRLFIPQPLEAKLRQWFVRRAPDAR
jgi:glycosyltransferase involved in cell wall biosynthesis